MRKINDSSSIDLDIRLANEGESFDINLRISDGRLSLSQAGLYEGVSTFSRLLGNRPTINISPTGARTYTPLHEFGHALGLGHQLNSTSSVMSYANGRTPALTARQTQNLLDAYR